MINWIDLILGDQLQTIKNNSFKNLQIIFKHSTRCSISSMAKNRLDKVLQPEKADFFYLDVIKYRIISNLVSETFNVNHESPQILLIKNGICIFDESHTGISMKEIIMNI